MKKILVLSLGGSLIAPEKKDPFFLHEFKGVLRSFYSKYKFIIVCGGGSIARTYIESLRKDGASEKKLSQVGIMATRMNAMTVMQLFGKEANDALPLNMKDIKDALPKNNVVICGALRFIKKATSDTTAAHLASHFKCSFINITNVKGLYTSNPLNNPGARFITHEKWGAFEKRARRHKYRGGQHFVLDQNAAKLIKKNSTPTYIVGKELINLKNLLANKQFIGTTIQG